MQSANNILLASHGTEGAQAAEQEAIKLCKKGGHLHHLIVVPKALWQGMTGDDWLNNGSTRNTFRRYLEEQLTQEVEEHKSRVSEAATTNNLNYTAEVIVGEPEKELIKVSRKEAYDIVIMGSSRPKGKTGLRSRMLTKSIRELSVPLLIVPYPDE
ncbi:MAG: universal stress protein [Acidiferrobacterales bacterium]